MTLEELLQASIELGNEKLLIENKRNELANKQLEINNAIQAEKKRLELEKVQVITIEDIRANIIIVDTNGTPRIDVLDLLRATPSRYYNYINQKNEINIIYWEQFIEALNKLPNINLIYSKDNKEKIEKYFTEPLWHVKMSDKFIIIKKAERNTEQFKLDKIPSQMYNTMVKATTVPFSEGWRVIQVLGEPSDSVVYEQDVLDLILKQIEQRKKMDEAALTMTANLPNPFTGINPETGNKYELKDYQKATVFFMMTALGMEIPQEKPKPKW